MPLYNDNFHRTDISNCSFLITGGAGFIGSNIVEYLVHHGAGEVRIMDNLCEGKLENIADFIELPNVQFLELDITNESDCQTACANIDYVSHQAALGSVPRSIETPLATNAANVTGFLNLMTAAKDAGVKRFVYASSSSVYGDSPEMPKVESQIGDPLSPYAATKYTNEVYAGTFGRCYGLETVGLRYFNVYGPRQKPDGPYAAVIPLFMDALLKNQSPFINGDGEQSRDFTFVSNAVQANVRGMFTTTPGASRRAYNVAVGERVTVNQLFQAIKTLTGATVDAVYQDPREGDVKHSLADISRAEQYLDYQPNTQFEHGLEITLDWFKKRFG